MVELLGMYTPENASTARKNAPLCILSALVDPNIFLLDPLLALKLVRFLESELIHDLLLIFGGYLKFHKDHKEFVESHLESSTKYQEVRLLTFMQLAESNPEMPFQIIEQELQIEEDQVESFIIDVLKTKLVSARMDEGHKVLVSSTMHRTFGRPQWLLLSDLLLPGRQTSIVSETE